VSRTSIASESECTSERTTGQVICRKPYRIRGGNRDSHLYNVFWVPKSLHPKEDLEPFSHVCTAKPRERETDYRVTDARIIDRTSPHVVHSMRSKSALESR